jgi:hypothetical protein
LPARVSSPKIEGTVDLRRQPSGHPAIAAARLSIAMEPDARSTPAVRTGEEQPVLIT